MNHLSGPLVPPRLVAALVVLAIGLAAGCSKKTEELPTPAVAVMPGDAPSPVDTSKPDVTPPMVGSTSNGSIVLPPPVTSVEGRGTVSVISGTAPPAAPSADTTGPPAAPLTAGLPPAPSASLPGATTIGPASAPTSDQPPSVSPGTK